MPTVNAMTSQMAPHRSLSRWTRPHHLAPLVRRTLTDSAYIFVGFPLAVASFTLVVSGVSMGAGGAILVGPPVLAATLVAARAFADLERRRIEPVLRMRFTRPEYKVTPPDAGVLRNMLTRITDPQSWRDAVHGLLVLMVSIVTFTFAVTWWSGAAAGLLYPIYDPLLPHDPNNYEFQELPGLPDVAAVRILFNLTVGVFFLVTLPLVMRVCAHAQAGMGRALLTDATGLRARIVGLEAARASAEARTTAAVSAEATALRKLERDIHDGPQQRLVRLAMDLGRAQQQLDTNPEAARQTVAEAVAQTRETLDELRALSRGIAPPVLADRGLPAAIAALAGRCTVPVDLEAPDLGRLDPAIENSAYFVIAESLTNVAKHSGATECRVRLDRLGDRLLVTVSDDGMGGAHVAKGHGLAGLADRAQAVGGTLTVQSPTGGPTTITAELPWR
jgi:signal transduction histidine kinase